MVYFEGNFSKSDFLDKVEELVDDLKFSNNYKVIIDGKDVTGDFQEGLNMVFVEIFNNENFKYELRKKQTIKQVRDFLKELNPKEVQRVVVFNPWTENVYVVVTEKYNFSFKFTIKQFTQMNEIFKQLNKGEEIEHKWY